RVVRRAEINGFSDDLLLTTTRADRLVVNRVAGLRAVFSGPFGINGVGEGCTRASNGSGVCAESSDTECHCDGNLFECKLDHCDLRLFGWRDNTCRLTLAYDMNVTVMSLFPRR